jgi:hypothetical protein
MWSHSSRLTPRGVGGGAGTAALCARLGRHNCYKLAILLQPCAGLILQKLFKYHTKKYRILLVKHGHRPYVCKDNYGAVQAELVGMKCWSPIGWPRGAHSKRVHSSISCDRERINVNTIETLRTTCPVSLSSIIQCNSDWWLVAKHMLHHGWKSSALVKKQWRDFILHFECL